MRLDVDNRLYVLSNGKVIRICNMIEEPDCDYGYDYFDGETKRLIDGGVFNAEGAEDADDVLAAALRICDVDPDSVTWELVSAEADYDLLEEMGFTGF